MKSVVKLKGKHFIVTDPFHNKSYRLDNKLDAESLSSTLNEVAYYKQRVNEVQEIVKELTEVKK